MKQAEPGKKLLVIDDESSTLKMLRLLLGAYGYSVLTAGTGEEGLEIFRNERPALVITDIRMPGMDGIEVLRHLRQISPEVETIVITGHGDMELAIRSLRNSASDFINKPIQREALEIALQRAEEKIELKRKIRDHAKELESRVEQATAALSHQNRRLEVLVKIGKQAGEIPAHEKMAEFLREKIETSTGLKCPRIIVLNSIRDGLYGDHSNSRQAKGSAMAAEMIKGLRGSPRPVTSQELAKMRLPLVEAEDRESITMLPIETEKGDPVGAALVVASGERDDGDLEFAGLLLSLVAGALRRAVVQEEEISNLRQIVEKEKFGNMIGRHEKMRRVFNLISNVAASDASVLILGESGTGKELAARRIHESVHEAPVPSLCSIAPPIRRRCWRPRCSAMKRAHSPAPFTPVRACSNSPREAPCSWTKSAISPCPPRSSSSGRSSSENSTGWGARPSPGSTFAYFRQRPGTCEKKSNGEPFGKTSITVFT